MSIPTGPRRDRNTSTSSSPTGTPVMPSQAAQTRRSRPSNVQTTLPVGSQLMAALPSAISTSSVPSSSHGSPILSPDAPPRTTASSMQASPEPLRAHDLELPAPLLLPESVLSRRTSTNSLQQPSPGGQTAMQEALKQNNNLIRRLSNKAKAISRRRPSSVHPNSRDGSIGPGILRRRSDSNNTAPVSDFLDRSTFDTDSEFDIVDERDDLISLLTSDGAVPDVSPTSAPASIAGSTGPSDSQSGPVIPSELRQGTVIRKVSRKNNRKRILLTLDAEAGKIVWDKSRPSKCIYIDDIKEIRTAEDIRQYRLDCGVAESEESRFFSILYAVPDKSQTKTMHLIADSDQTFFNWTSTLDAIYKHRQDSMASLMAFNDKAVRSYWQREMARQFADKPYAVDDGEIDFTGVERVCRNLHIHVAQETLRANFAEADATRTSRLNFTEFQDFVRLMKRREDIRAVYRAIASDPGSGITCEEFLDFLRGTQGENVDDDLASWQAVFARFSRRVRGDSGEEEMPRMSETALSSFLTSTFNLAIVKEPREYALDRPMNEYYISSSHNTYLLGRQLIGVSSVEGYITSLMQGCRCVEVDCWDGNDGQPIVVHGMTWTSNIAFREVINVINKYAFVKSRFPLWISLEVHCNNEQQKIMARIMREVFGSKLVTEPLTTGTSSLPAPSELKERILIKTKKTQPAGEPNTNGEANAPSRRRGNSLTSPYPKAVPLDNSAVPAQNLAQGSPLLSARKSSNARGRVETITEGEVRDIPSSSTSDCDSGSEKPPTKHRQSKIVPELGELAVYCVGIQKSTGFDEPDAKMYNHIYSWNENDFERHSKTRDAKRAVYRHNMRYLMRVYPRQSRWESTNFNPLAFWRKGVQMAALNWQTFDLGMQINRAMFDGGTDQSGYVLKPRECREFQVLPNLPGESKPRELKRERKNVSFCIDVISAQQLMRPINFPDKRTLDPFVEIEVFLPDDKRDKEESGNGAKQSLPPPASTPLSYRTKIVRENGFNPIFDQKCAFNLTTKYPDLVFVRWTLKLADNGRYSNASTTASFTAKLSSLKQGYRTIPLCDVNGDRYLFSTLFCEVRKSPITSIYVSLPDDNEPESVNRLKRVFNRSTAMSPKSSVDGGPS